MIGGVRPIEHIPQGWAIGYIALGSNQGDRLDKLSEAVFHLKSLPESKILAVSSAYETSPVGMPVGTRDFLNAVAKIVSAMPPHDLLVTCLGIERLMGRDRGLVVQDRPIDLDLLHVDGVQSSTRDLILPHPRAHVRSFVLIPWIEIEPGLTLYGARLEDWLEMLPEEEWTPCELAGTIPDYDESAM